MPFHQPSSMQDLRNTYVQTSYSMRENQGVCFVRQLFDYLCLSKISSIRQDKKQLL